MNMKLERVAEKARKETNLKFSSLAHHITKELIWESLERMSKYVAPGIDLEMAEGALKDFDLWIDKLMESIHRKSYQPPVVRRVWIPKLGKDGKSPSEVSVVVDRALQRSTAKVLSVIYEQDFLDCSFGGRPGRGADNALVALDKIIAEESIRWVLQADLQNFFVSLDHLWMLEFLQYRVGDPRIIAMINRWLKAGVMENGEIRASEVGTPPGGSLSVLLGNIYLHYVLDLWFETGMKLRFKGEAYLIRDLDNVIVCFQDGSDANYFRETLKKRLKKFSLTFKPNRICLAELGPIVNEHVKEQGRRFDTLYFSRFHPLVQMQ